MALDMDRKGRIMPKRLSKRLYGTIGRRIVHMRPDARLAGDAQSLSRRERDHIAEVEGRHDRIDAVIATFVPVCMDTEIEIDLGRRLHGEDIHLAHLRSEIHVCKKKCPGTAAPGHQGLSAASLYLRGLQRTCRLLFCDVVEEALAGIGVEDLHTACQHIDILIGLAVLAAAALLDLDDEQRRMHLYKDAGSLYNTGTAHVGTHLDALALE
jgi:hypothetical protein